MGNLNTYLENGKKIDECQSCYSRNIIKFLSLGNLPIANDLFLIDTENNNQILYPTDLFFCKNCFLVQLGFIVKPEIIFPKNFPYTSSSTKALRDNFDDLANECINRFKIHKDDLILDIGSNDGNLLSFFKDYSKVLGVTPEDVGQVAIDNGIPTIIDFFNKNIAKTIVKNNGKAKIITSTNTFAHIPDVNSIVEAICNVLTNDGVFITESHYFYNLFETFQYDAIYHEHLRYYSFHSLKYILEKNGLEVFDLQEIKTHGGSLRVYAAIKGKYKIEESVYKLIAKEKNITSIENMNLFRDKVEEKKNKLLNLIKDLKKKDCKIFGIGAAARASTLINYVGLNNYIDAVLEIKGSKKIGFYMSGTKIPIYQEDILIKENPEYLLLLSWHISDIIIPKLRAKGFKGKFIIPLPEPIIIE